MGRDEAQRSLPSCQQCCQQGVGEEEEKQGGVGEEKDEDKISERKDTDSFIFRENAESKLLRKFLTNWESYFNKSVKETSTEIKGKKKKD